MSNDYKYPYISDKQLYAATMYACKLIRKYGTFNVACKTAANKYHVARSDVEREVHKRQAAGRKKANANRAPRKYRYFIVEYDAETYDGSCKTCIGISIEKATSAENAERKFCSHDDGASYRGRRPIGPGYSHMVVGNVNGYETAEEAEAACKDRAGLQNEANIYYGHGIEDAPLRNKWRKK